MRVLCLALGLLAVCCDRAPRKAAAHTNVSGERLSAAAPRDRYADDLGRFLAGMPARAGSQFGELEKQPAWIKHRR
jgi:hypothetical protein